MIGHIYKITETLTGPEMINNYIYIGSTINKEKRYATHKTNFKQSKNRKLYKLIHNMNFEILETVEIENRKDLFEIEGGYIRQYINNDDYICLNYQIAGRTKKQYCKDNSHIRNARAKKQYLENKEALLLYHKQYYQNNKDKLKKYQAESYARKNKKL